MKETQTPDDYFNISFDGILILLETSIFIIKQESIECILKVQLHIHIFIPWCLYCDLW